MSLLLRVVLGLTAGLILGYSAVMVIGSPAGARRPDPRPGASTVQMGATPGELRLLRVMTSVSGVVDRKGRSGGREAEARPPRAAAT